MNAIYFPSKFKHLALTILGVLLFVFPLISFGGGGGGGGEGTGYGNVSINGVTSAHNTSNITGVSQTDGIVSGNYNGVSVSYNSTTGGWEGSTSQGGYGGGSSFGGGIPSGGGGGSQVVGGGGSCPAGTTSYFNDSYFWYSAPNWTETHIRWAGQDVLWNWVNPGTSYQTGGYTYYRGGYRGHGSGKAGGYFAYYDVCRETLAPTLSFTADDYSVPYDTATTLRWSSARTNSCTASGAWSGSKSTSGSEGTGALRSPSTYFMQCSGSGGSTPTRSVTVDIVHGTGADINACKSVVYKEEEFCINYNVGTSQPQHCVIEAGSNTIAGPLAQSQGSIDWSITGETTFTLNCEEGGNIDSTTVRVLPEFQET